MPANRKIGVFTASVLEILFVSLILSFIFPLNVNLNQYEMGKEKRVISSVVTHDRINIDGNDDLNQTAADNAW